MNVRTVLPKDSIPSIDDPAFGREYIGDPDDEVIVVDSVTQRGTERSNAERSEPRDEAEPPRAYPIRLLSYHEIVNDIVDGRPIAVTWCPICWSAAVYNRTVEGRTLTFGMSGKLADDALVMYDRETDSEWKQPTGTAIAGELEGTRLPTLSAPIVTWERFTTDHPEGVVLQPVRGTGTETGQSPRKIYDMQPYDRYVDSEVFGLYGMRGEGERRTWDREDLDAKTVVLGIEHDGEAVGYPVQRIDAEGGAVTDTVGGLDVVVFSSDERIHAFENPGFEFEYRAGSTCGDGTTWDPVTGGGADGRRLDPVPGRRQFAFAWQDAHGPDAFYR